MDNSILMTVSCLCTFLSGFAAGILWRPRPKAKAEPIRNTEYGEQMLKTIKEYKNFLSYDGSVQE